MTARRNESTMMRKKYGFILVKFEKGREPSVLLEIYSKNETQMFDIIDGQPRSDETPFETCVRICKNIMNHDYISEHEIDMKTVYRSKDNSEVYHIYDASKWDIDLDSLNSNKNFQWIKYTELKDNMSYVNKDAKNALKECIKFLDKYQEEQKEVQMDSCFICSEDIEDGNFVFELPCCEKTICISCALRVNNKCPYCRRTFTNQQLRKRIASNKEPHKKRYRTRSKSRRQKSKSKKRKFIFSF